MSTTRVKSQSAQEAPDPQSGSGAIALPQFPARGIVVLMNITRPKNTKERGVVEFLTYKEGKSYVGVCLTFDIVEEGKDPVELVRSLKEAAGLHVDAVVKNNLSDDLLNRYAPKEYWKKYFEATKGILGSPKLMNSFPVVSPYSNGLVTQVA